MRFALSMLAVALMLIAGCHSSKKSGDDGAANAEVTGENKPAENTAKANEAAEPEAKDPAEDEFCLLPPAAQDDELGGKIKVGQEPPDFDMVDSLTGKNFKFADFKGKTVFIFFWASWCPYCKMAFRPKGSLNRFWTELNATADSNLVFIGIGTGTDDSEEGQKAFMKTNGATFLTAHDGTLEIEEAYGVLGMPTCVVIGREGKIITYGSYRSSQYSDDLLEYLRQSCMKNPESE